MELSCQAYMKAADLASPIGSGQSVVTTASGSSVSTMASQSDLSYSNANESPVSGAVAHKTGTELRRTPLSTKARPFVSSKIQWKDWKQEPALLISVQPVLVQSAVMPMGASQQPQSYFYSERAQEDIYLQQTPAYNEALQEDIYLAEAQALSSKRQPHIEEASTSDEISNSDVQTEAKASSRSPSPAPVAPVANRKTTKKGTPRPTKTILSEPLPVKHTFIHYAPENDLEEDAEKLPMFSTRQTSRARSAPRVLIQNDFAGLSFTRVMATVHLRHNCQPCAYFHNKIDGCRRGLECKFCHLCPADELKKRKKLKIKALKEKLERQSEIQKESENDETAADEKIAVSED
mmetsp:Transcript_9777/g.18175  ORF Transcript_9777/g.18175 Transcript_9777/m.18175 type:complete len:349 (-) Transcript_9777:227-1273(-)